MAPSIFNPLSWFGSSSSAVDKWDMTDRKFNNPVFIKTKKGNDSARIDYTCYAPSDIPGMLEQAQKKLVESGEFDADTKASLDKLSAATTDFLSSSQSKMDVRAYRKSSAPFAKSLSERSKAQKDKLKRRSLRSAASWAEAASRTADCMTLPEATSAISYLNEIDMATKSMQSKENKLGLKLANLKKSLTRAYPLSAGGKLDQQKYEDVLSVADTVSNLANSVYKHDPKALPSQFSWDEVSSRFSDFKSHCQRTLKVSDYKKNNESSSASSRRSSVSSEGAGSVFSEASNAESVASSVKSK